MEPKYFTVAGRTVAHAVVGNSAPSMCGVARVRLTRRCYPGQFPDGVRECKRCARALAVLRAEIADMQAAEDNRLREQWRRDNYDNNTPACALTVGDVFVDVDGREVLVTGDVRTDGGWVRMDALTLVDGEYEWTGVYELPDFAVVDRIRRGEEMPLTYWSLLGDVPEGSVLAIDSVPTRIDSVVDGVADNEVLVTLSLGSWETGTWVPLEPKLVSAETPVKVYMGWVGANA